MPVIVVAEADAKSRRMLQRFLNSKGLEARAASSVPETVQGLRGVRSDALLVGLGAGALRRLRGLGVEEPALALLSEDTLEERRLCFSAGADVWLPRPVDPEEAALLLWAMVRRYGGGLQAVVALGEAWLDEPARELRLPGKALPLPPREYAVLALLMAHPRRVFSRQEIMDRLWELGCESGPRSVDIYISRLRARCGGEWGFSIQTVRGLGYRLVAIPAPEGEREAREATSK